MSLSRQWKHNANMNHKIFAAPIRPLPNPILTKKNITQMRNIKYFLHLFVPIPPHPRHCERWIKWISCPWMYTTTSDEQQFAMCCRWLPHCSVHTFHIHYLPHFPLVIKVRICSYAYTTYHMYTRSIPCVVLLVNVTEIPPMIK
jgi:hypothetical protein